MKEEKHLMLKLDMATVEKLPKERRLELNRILMGLGCSRLSSSLGEWLINCPDMKIWPQEQNYPGETRIEKLSRNIWLLRGEGIKAEYKWLTELPNVIESDGFYYIRKTPINTECPYCDACYETEEEVCLGDISEVSELVVDLIALSTRIRKQEETNKK